MGTYVQIWKIMAELPVVQKLCHIDIIFNCKWPQGKTDEFFLRISFEASSRSGSDDSWRIPLPVMLQSLLLLRSLEVFVIGYH